MSVKVNLLPREVEARVRERRIALGSLTALAVWVLLLALLYLQSVLSANSARSERDAEQAELNRLIAQADRLAPYRELAQRYDAGNRMLAAAMGSQVAWSGVLNDLALVFPANSSLLTLNASLGNTAGPPGVPDEVPLVGNVQFTGYTVERFAPGVESVLLGLDEAGAFHSLYLSSAARVLIANTEVTNFSGSGELTERVYSRRFAQGLPEDER